MVVLITITVPPSLASSLTVTSWADVTVRLEAGGAGGGRGTVGHGGRLPSSQADVRGTREGSALPPRWLDMAILSTCLICSVRCKKLALYFHR